MNRWNKMSDPHFPVQCPFQETNLHLCFVEALVTRVIVLVGKSAQETQNPVLNPAVPVVHWITRSPNNTQAFKPLRSKMSHWKEESLQNQAPLLKLHFAEHDTGSGDSSSGVGCRRPVGICRWLPKLYTAPQFLWYSDSRKGKRAWKGPVQLSDDTQACCAAQKKDGFWASGRVMSWIYEKNQKCWKNYDFFSQSAENVVLQTTCKNSIRPLDTQHQPKASEIFGGIKNWVPALRQLSSGDLNTPSLPPCVCNKLLWMQIDGQFDVDRRW